ncbi:hypothetical protein BRADI_1g35357v3 [Brachypodium distachyon]|uniref:Uncharacterized protein n=1 Tax=Brachypodium distachyon TaxID=15368 RepID=A0A2K2DMT3_BRADI|nr:hypothetical protein BRADI_1g35357v3 [Brachypodium distachyon]
MHQIGSGMYVSGRAPDPDKKRERRQLSSGSVATPPYTGGDVSRSGELGRMFDVAAAAWLSQSQAPSPASSSRRSSGPLQQPPGPSAPSPAASGPLSQLSHSGLLVGPSPSPGPSPARAGSSSSWRKKKAGRMRFKDAAAAAAPVVARGRARLGVPFACYVLVLVAAAGVVGAGVFCLVAWRRWEALAAACGVVAFAAALFSWNVARCAAEVERFFRRSPDTVFDDGQGDCLPVGELVKITGQVTCGRVPVGACFHDGARCVFTSVQMYGRRGWAWACCCRRWQLKHSEVKFLSNQGTHRSCLHARFLTLLRGRRISTSPTGTPGGGSTCAPGKAVPR